MREAVILDAVRTPIGRRKGALSATHPVDLLGGLMAALLGRASIDPQLVDDVIMGCVSQVGEQAVNIARNAWLTAGLPESVPATTIDRQCGSSLQALQFAAQGVLSGGYELALAGGVESMTRVPLMSSILSGPGTPLTDSMARRYELPDGWFNQARGAEMIARRWGLSRHALDIFSVESHRRAASAAAEGRFQREIVPVGEFAADEGVRPHTSLEQVAALRPAFEGLELITAGNASQISDGASAALIASRELAERLELRPRARFVAFSAVGVDPVTMLTGPIPATRRVLERAGLRVEDIDLFEVNEAFAPVVLSWQQELGVPDEKVNVNGGAIALGHPLGATGGRLLATLLSELERRQARYGLIAICEGGGMANAAIVERL